MVPRISITVDHLFHKAMQVAMYKLSEGVVSVLPQLSNSSQLGQIDHLQIIPTS